MLKEFGNDLKLLRESKGVTIAEIAAQTRVNPKFFLNLEAGNFDFQPATYVRAFMKEYARTLDVDENRILNEYDKAKAGFYAKRSILKDTPGYKEQVEEKLSQSIDEIVPVKKVSNDEDLEIKRDIKHDSERVIPQYKPMDFKEKPEPEFSNKTWTSRILLFLLLAALVVLVIYFIKYLNSSEDNSREVKPKSFSEMSADYENKLKGVTSDTIKKDSVSGSVVLDSLILSVIVKKYTTVKIFIDESNSIERELSVNDTLFVKAKEKFRFSSNSNSSVDLYLNGKYLRKPSTLTGSSIKNLVINKDGIVTK